MTVVRQFFAVHGADGAPTVWQIVLRARLDQVLHTVVLPGLTRLHSKGARLNR